MMAAVGTLFLSLLISQAYATPTYPLELLVSVSKSGATSVTAKATLKNNGDTILKLFNDPRSILSKITHFGVKSTIFEIVKEPDVTSVPCKPHFKGVSVIFDPLQALKSTNSLDFTVLKPGQTIEVDYDLKRSYDFAHCGPGSYNIKAFHSFYHVGDSGALLQTIEASTHMSQLHVVTTSRPTSTLRKSNSFRKRDLYFKSCTDDESFQITDAAILADELVEHAKNELDALVAKKARSRYQTWFGHYDQLRLHIVKQHFLHLPKKATTFTYDCGACRSKFGSAKAWVYAYIQTHPNSTRKLYLCESFWKIPRNTVGSKPGLFINALSRLPENGGTTDYYITPSEIEKLALKNPEGAVQNSESHRRL
ncbi:putative deuterolysin M35 metalloprotease [Rhizoctonia solani 123E]|uniref:Putative deuterolysin M35 metalloprotease n=1 Tax=Rhizoctonia solani 123E TaxID=1423351 RepID=A0A074RU46_9AGAM|nr:putative deuterolysin M35 metalloprotease [Rhizoctonia solani 123E]